MQKLQNRQHCVSAFMLCLPKFPSSAHDSGSGSHNRPGSICKVLGADQSSCPWQTRFHLGPWVSEVGFLAVRPPNCIKLTFLIVECAGSNCKKAPNGHSRLGEACAKALLSLYLSICWILFYFSDQSAFARRTARLHVNMSAFPPSLPQLGR